MIDQIISPNEISATIDTCVTPLPSDAYFDAGAKSPSKRPDRFTHRYQTHAEALRHEKYDLSVHADMIKIHRMNRSLPYPLDSDHNHKRGIVRGFSRASRKRMIEFMAKVRFNGSMLFLTVTYPDHFPPDSAIWHADFESFRRRFERKYPSWRGIWRIEVIDRKSGDNTGVVAPHWHILVFLPSHLEPAELQQMATIAQDEMSVMWDEIVQSGDPDHLNYGVDLKPVVNRKHAYRYVSKYAAKISPDILEIGRRWGRIGAFDCEPSETITITYDEYITLRRLCKNWMRRRNGKFYRQFARQTPLLGCAVLGIGDTLENGNLSPSEAKFGQFLREVKRYIETRCNIDRQHID